MKRCPTCQRSYLDQTLKFCREDGARLITDPLLPLEPQTEIFGRTDDDEEPATEIFSSGTSGAASTSRSLTRPVQKRGPRRSKVIDSLAVLPMTNASDDPEIEYLSDGLTESLINNLSSVHGLRVMARATVFRYKGREIDPQQIGRELDVRAVVTGRVLVRQERLIVKVELVKVEDGSQLWGEHYKRRLEDIFAIESEMAGEIAEKLRLKLNSKARKRLAKRSTENSEAYQSLLKGRYFFSKQTAEGFQKAIEYFEQALTQDPAYALAHAELAKTYYTLLYFGYLRLDETQPKIAAALSKALSLDQNLAEAHLILAENKFHYDWDWQAAEREFRRALELNPGHAETHLVYAFYLADMERFEEAINEALRAQELDPLSLFTQMGAGFIFSIAHRADEALEQGHKLLEMEPHFFGAHWLVGMAHFLKGMYEEAIAESLKAHALGGGPIVLTFLGFLYGLTGRRSEALKVIEELSEMRKQNYVPASNFAMVYAGLGELDQSFEWLERAYRERNPTLTSLKVNTALDPLRSDPRFTQMLSRVGLISQQPD
ncbi:MAG TPA: tetratricopeptide repeat protein [Pyrinomonadaceae bacterium]|jgi:TolB-like protein